MDAGQEDARGPVRGKSTQPRYEKVGWYERHAGRARVFYRTSQSAVVVVARLTPVIALWEVFERYDVLPAALASVLAAVVGLWRRP